MTPAPYDATLPSPIAALLALRASGQGAVVDAGSSSDLQDRMRVDTGVASAILDLARSPAAPALILISGSAGGGKSVLIDELLRRGSDAFAAWIEDATHSDSPTDDQMERLAAFLAPLADGATPAQGPPLLLAMNTGMLIRFFDQLRDARGADHGFTALESTLASRLAIDDADGAVPDLADRVAVVNLDGRPTCGGSGSLLRDILASLDPDDAEGVLAGSPRCATCSVTAYCWPRTNAALLAAPQTAAAVDSAAAGAARERGRWPSPRELWDAASHLATGGATFGVPDPCAVIAQVAASHDRAAVWDHLLITGPFRNPPSRLVDEIARADPSFAALPEVHRILSSAGVDPERDARAIVDALGGPRSPAVDTGVATITHDESAPPRPEIARALVRARWLAGALEAATAPAHRPVFDAALVEYPRMGDGGDLLALDQLLILIERGFAASFGEHLGAETYYRTEAHDTSRTVAVLSKASIADFLFPLADRTAAANPVGAGLVGHTPLAIDISVAGVRLSVSFPLFRLLAGATEGTVPSTQDLERFSSLKRAAEALGRQAANHRDEPLMFVIAGPGGSMSRYRASQRRDRFTAGHVTAVEDVSGQ